MNGWNRLKLVLSLIYWSFAALYAAVPTFADGVSNPTYGLIVLAIFAAVYLMLAGVWWAFAGFRRRR